MDILILIIGIIIVVLLAIVIVLLIKRNSNKNELANYKAMEERLIRMEGEVSKINPSIDRNFRENRKEIADNLERLQTGNEKKLEEMRESERRTTF